MHNGSLRRRNKIKRAEKYLKKKKTENFPNMRKNSNIKIQEASQTLCRIHLKRSTPGHIITKLSKDKGKERILKASSKNWHDHMQGILNKINNSFLWETMEASYQWNGIFKFWKKKDTGPVLLTSSQQDGTQ